MGRPLNSKYFGHRNPGGVAGSSVEAIALGTAGSGYSQGLTVTVGTPDLVSIGGVTATASVGVNTATGAVTGYTIITGGSGYDSPPTIELHQPDDATPTGSGVDTTSVITVSSAAGIYVGMEVSGLNVGVGALVESISGLDVTVTVANSGTVSGTITFSDGGSSAVPGAVTLSTNPVTSYDKVLRVSAVTVGTTNRTVTDIVKQTGSHHYLVKNQDGTAVCKLVAATPAAAGEMSLKATDSAGGTYYVTKLTAHKARLTRNTGTQFATGVEVPWTLGTAVENYSVLIDYLS